MEMQKLIGAPQKILRLAIRLVNCANAADSRTGRGLRPRRSRQKPSDSRRPHGRPPYPCILSGGFMKPPNRTRILNSPFSILNYRTGWQPVLLDASLVERAARAFIESPLR